MTEIVKIKDKWIFIKYFFLKKSFQIVETPSATAPATVNVESEAPKEASEKVESEVVAAVENGNKITEEKVAEAEVKQAETVQETSDNNTPKTNGNNSHSNGSAENSVVVPQPPIAKEQEQNGASAANNDNEKLEAKASEQSQPNGELENGVVSVLQLSTCTS